MSVSFVTEKVQTGAGKELEKIFVVIEKDAANLPHSEPVIIRKAVRDEVVKEKGVWTVKKHLSGNAPGVSGPPESYILRYPREWAKFLEAEKAKAPQATPLPAAGAKPGAPAVPPAKPAPAAGAPKPAPVPPGKPAPAAADAK